MKVLVLGATGNLGGHVVRRALDAGHEVRALARNPSAFAVQGNAVHVMRGDARDASSLELAVAGQEAVISCLGTKDRKDATLRTDGARNAIAAMRKHDGRRLIVFSAFGVAESRPQLQRSSFMFGRIILPLLLKTPFEDMARMETEVRSSGLDWTIVRPCALTRKPATGNVKILVDESGDIGSSIPYADVAGFMVEQLVDDRFIGKAPAISA